MTARALANSLCATPTPGGAPRTTANDLGLSSQPRKVSFFMRKGADCLSKWVGEGERQLRLLFEQAKRYEPSIIFFDEIDGLAPVRSVKQDQIHASIVSTLLALMDGLDSRGQVVVIGATNRPDAIDPALRRPGRFDRELAFPLPDACARRAILDIHTKSWKPPLSPFIKDWIIDQSVGYCGADIKALCAEATIMSLRRAYPQVYTSNVRLDFDPTSLQLTKGDFAASLSRIVPASRRASTSSSSACTSEMHGLNGILLQEYVEMTINKIRDVFRPANEKGVGATARTATKQYLDHQEKIEEIIVERGDKEEFLAALTDVSHSDICQLELGFETRNEISGHDKDTDSASFLWDPTYSAAVSRVMLTGEKYVV